MGLKKINMPLQKC